MFDPKYYDYERREVVTIAELRKNYATAIIDGSINPEECDFCDWMADALGKNGTLETMDNTIKSLVGGNLLIDINDIVEKYAKELGIDPNNVGVVWGDKVIPILEAEIIAKLMNAYHEAPTTEPHTAGTWNDDEFYGACL